MLDRLWSRYRFLLLAGFAYLIFIEETGDALPCPFRLLTGWKCPGCGVTHLVLALAHGDLAGAWQANPAIVLASPFLLLLWWRSERSAAAVEPVWQKLLAWGLVLYFLSFGVWRNL